MRHVAHANADRFLPGVPCFRRPHGECLLEKVSKRCFAAEMNDFLAESVGVKLNAFCLPAGRNLSYRLVRAVLAHLERQPPNPETGTATLVAAALSKAFPCTEPLEPKK